MGGRNSEDPQSLHLVLDEGDKRGDHDHHSLVDQA
jgi:hypothetical protein